MKSTLIVLPLLFALIRLNAQSVPDHERDHVIAAVNEYLEGRNKGDVERLRNAFLPNAILKGVDPSTQELVITPITEYTAKQTPGRVHQCTSEISFVNHVNQIAVAQVILTYETYAYHDYLILVKIKDKGIISEKVYTKVEIKKS